MLPLQPRLCQRSEAIHLAAYSALDCFAALAMTVSAGHTPASAGARGGGAARAGGGGAGAADPDRGGGWALFGFASYAQARPCYERALAIYEKALGPDHPDTANSLNNLGLLLQEQGDLAGARPHYECALAISEKALGPDHPKTRIGRDNLSSLDDN
jgi:tetratricopeptide (TPR) repeat protein